MGDRERPGDGAAILILTGVPAGMPALRRKLNANCWWWWDPGLTVDREGI
jgi:hypothetical protein